MIKLSREVKEILFVFSVMLAAFLAISLFILKSEAQFTNPQKAVFPDINLLNSKNPGFESGKTGWTASAGTYTVTTTGSNVGSGTTAASWATGAASRTFTSSAVTIPSGLFATNGVISCNIKGATGAHTFTAWDGSSILATMTLPVVTGYQRSSLNFIFPSSGTIAIQITSVTSETIYIDDCYIGTAYGFNISQVSMASVYGTAKWVGVASCAWTTVGAFANFAADTDCTSPTGSNLTGYASAPATKVPGISFTNLPPGEYIVTAQGWFRDATGDTNDCSFRLHDGTTAGTASDVFVSGGLSSIGTVIGRFVYTTTQSSITFQVQSQSSDAGNTCSVNAGTVTVSELQLIVKRYPTSSETSFKADQSAQAWSGYHANDCSWARTDTAYGNPTADASCTFTERKNLNFGSVTASLSGSDDLPGIVFTPSAAGFYFVCASPKFAMSNLAAIGDLRLWDGTTVISETEQTEDVANDIQTHAICGIYQATSTSAVTLSLQTKASAGSLTIAANSTNASAVEWSLVNITRSVSDPLLVGSVTSNTSGIERAERAQIGSTASPCTTASCTITSQSGTWLSGVTRASAGTYAMTFVAGMFSSAPACTINTMVNAPVRGCRISSITTSGADMLCDDGTSAADAGFTIICMGAR